MDIRSVLVSALVAACLTGIQASIAEGVDGNAVGGSARSAVTDADLGGVNVSVVQNARVEDDTRESDGVYSLKVPLSNRVFDLLYRKSGYLDSYDLDIINNRESQKRPIAEMVQEQAISSLPPNELQRLVDKAITAIQRGKDIDAIILIQSGKRNLEILYRNIEPYDLERKRLREQIVHVLRQM